MDANYPVSYDSDEAPKTREECRTRLIEAIIWEFLDEDCGLFMESPCSTFHDWNEAAQKRYIKEAKKLIKKRKLVLVIRKRRKFLPKTFLGILLLEII